MKSSRCICCKNVSASTLSDFRAATFSSSSRELLPSIMHEEAPKRPKKSSMLFREAQPRNCFFTRGSFKIQIALSKEFFLESRFYDFCYVWVSVASRWLAAAKKRSQRQLKGSKRAFRVSPWGKSRLPLKRAASVFITEKQEKKGSNRQSHKHTHTEYTGCS